MYLCKENILYEPNFLLTRASLCLCEAHDPPSIKVGEPVDREVDKWRDVMMHRHVCNSISARFIQPCGRRVSPK